MTEQRRLQAVNEDGALIPPHNTDYERWVIGTAMAHPHTINDLRATGLTATTFYTLAHELTWAAILTLHVQNKPVDPITVAKELDRRKEHRPQLRQATAGPTAAWLATIYGDARLPTNALYYADELVQLQTTRRNITTATRALTNPEHAADIFREHLEQEQARAAGTTNTSSWTPVDLEPVLSGDDTGPVPAHLARRDGQRLLYPGAIHSISGEPGSGKTWLAVYAIAQELEAGNDVAFIDFEDRAATLVGRLRGLGITDDVLRAHLRYIRPEMALSPDTRPLLAEAVTGCTVAVVDGITEAMTLHGLSLMDNEDVARWLALVPHYIAHQGPAVAQIDHVVKNSEARGRYAIGGQHKLAGITGAAYKLLTVRSFGRGNTGTAKLVLDKDRHGHIGQTGTTVAEFTLDATAEDGTLYAQLDTPSDDHAEDGTWRPTRYMTRISQMLEKSGGVTGNTIRSAINGKEAHITHALNCLINEGYVRVEKGKNNARFHYSVQPFGEDDQ